LGEVCDDAVDLGPDETGELPLVGLCGGVGLLEGLARGPAEKLATLLHEAAHALAHVRGMKDTFRQGVGMATVASTWSRTAIMGSETTSTVVAADRDSNDVEHTGR
jgi:hypothetical protein